ncbi:MAG: hypothetical protein OXH52_02700, partial [Gammaproteobacteria bacterium]|nr:hypothetical protein [Gammaproteobacteria bacterium]
QTVCAAKDITSSLLCVNTPYFADPKEELLCVCLTQVLNAGMMPNNNYSETFQRLVYQSLV